jgi:hypothetical protein
MAMTNSERQKAYRLRRDDGEGDRRLNTWINSTANFALDRLARRYAVTKREMIERLVLEADAAILKSLELDSPDWDEYMNVTP